MSSNSERRTEGRTRTRACGRASIRARAAVCLRPLRSEHGREAARVAHAGHDSDWCRVALARARAESDARARCRRDRDLRGRRNGGRLRRGRCSRCSGRCAACRCGWRCSRLRLRRDNLQVVRRRPSLLSALLDEPPPAVVLRYDLDELVLRKRELARLIRLECEQGLPLLHLGLGGRGNGRANRRRRCLTACARLGDRRSGGRSRSSVRDAGRRSGLDAAEAGRAGQSLRLRATTAGSALQQPFNVSIPFESECVGDAR